jgi:intracellular sulfur oxidation DsrE/DsrF family protein
MFLGMLQADANTAKVVFDLTTSDLQTFERKVLKGIAAHKAHYEGSLKELEVAVIIHGGAYKFFVQDTKHPLLNKEKGILETHDTLSKRIASMADTYDVKFLMCKSGMKAKKLEKEDVYNFVQTVPNAAIGLIDKQNEGFAYIPI